MLMVQNKIGEMMETGNKENHKQSLKIVTWNCKGGFQKKFEEIKKLNADVYIIQECKKPDIDPFSDYSIADWDGTLGKKGVGIFVRKGITFQKKDRIKGVGGFYVACSIENGPDILGIWAWHKNGTGKNLKDYSKDLLVDLKNYQDKLNSNYIIAGDFNMDESNWEPEIIQFLKEKGLTSAYHNSYPEIYGQELKMTHYTDQKFNQTQPYLRYKPSTHIDYIFVSPDRIKHFELGSREEWIYQDQEWVFKEGCWKKPNLSQNDRSDHVPLIIDLKLNRE